MLLLIVLLGLISLGMYTYVLFRLVMREGFTKGLIGLIFPPYTFIWGWQKATYNQLTRLMIAWSSILGAQTILLLIMIFTK